MFNVILVGDGSSEFKSMQQLLEKVEIKPIVFIDKTAIPILILDPSRVYPGLDAMKEFIDKRLSSAGEAGRFLTGMFP